MLLSFVKTNSTKDLLAIIISGLLGFLAYPTVISGYHFPDLGFLIWFHLVPLLIICRTNFLDSFLKSLSVSIISYFGLLYWLAPAMQNFGGLNVFESYLMLFVLMLVLAITFAVMFSLALEISKKAKLSIILVLPVGLTIYNHVIEYFPFGGYPWGLPPYSQGHYLSWFQWVDILGPLGLSFLIYLINACIFLLALSIKPKFKKPFKPLVGISLACITSIGLNLYSQNTFTQTKQTLPQIKLSLVQANIDQDIKWDRMKSETILKAYKKITLKAFEDKPDLVLWPETAYPYAFDYQKIKDYRFLNEETLAAPVLFGASILDLSGTTRKQYNAIIQTNKTSQFVDFYHKIHLVPFGEYLPFKEYLTFLKSLSQGIGFFNPGNQYSLFDVKGLKIGPLICIEDVLSRYARRFTQSGADILVNFTNDGWYGDTSAQHQHLVYSQLRALENRRIVVRATNTGMTAIIAPDGEVVKKIEPFLATHLTHQLIAEKSDSLYTRYGDGWVMGLYILMLGMLARAFIKPLRPLN